MDENKATQETGTISMSSLVSDPPKAQAKQEAQGNSGNQDNTGSNDQNVDWKKRYADSSREALKLKAEADKAKALEAENARLKEEREKFKPFDDMLVKRPDFVEHVKEFFDGSGKAANPNQNTAMTPQKYGMESYSDFDLQEAYSNPNSPSGRMLSDRDQMVAGGIASKIVDQKLRAFEATLQQEKAITQEQRMRDEFLAKHPDKTQEDLDKMLDWAKGNPLTLDRVNMLYALENDRDGLFNAGQDEVRQQMARSNSMPKTMASKASGDARQKSEADAFFDSIKQSATLSLGRTVTN